MRDLRQVKGEWDNGRIRDIKLLEEKLSKLRAELYRLETEEVEKMRLKRIAADMGDDYRENEPAKLVMAEEHLMFVGMGYLRKEIVELRKKIITERK